MGTWYDYSIAFASFASDLKDKLVANGWTQQEVGYNTCLPAGYSIYIEPSMAYNASKAYADGSASTGQYTWLRMRMRSAYDAGNHRPNTGNNGGCANLRLVFNGGDWSASATGLLFVRGWIWNKGFILFIKPDPATVTSGTLIPQILICAEGQAVDAGANTMFLLSPCWGEEETEYGGKSFDVTNFDCMRETHLIHCLGDAHGYVPMALGFAVSALSNKLRTMPLYIWRYRSDGANLPCEICYQITQLRPVMFWDSPQIDQINDTFTLDGKTYKYANSIGAGSLPNYSDQYGRPLISKLQADKALSCAYIYGGATVTNLSWAGWLVSAEP